MTSRLDEAPARGLTRRDLLRRGGAIGGTLLWVTPAIQVINLTSASAALPSGRSREDLPSHLEIVVHVTTAFTFTHNGTSYTVAAGDYGLKYEFSSGWVFAPRNPATCIPSSTSYDQVQADYVAILAYFQSNVSVGEQLYLNKASYVVQVPNQFTVVTAVSKKGRTCGTAVHSGNVYYFPGN